MQNQEEYLSTWLGMPKRQIEEASIVHIVTSERHNEILFGWLNYIPVYAFLAYNKLFVSCTPGLETELQHLCEAKDCAYAVDLLISYFESQSPNTNYSSKVFWLNEYNHKIDSSEAVLLEHRHYAEYIDFFKKKSPAIWEFINPDNEQSQEFDELLSQRIGYCIFRDDIIISCAETQASPYRPDGAAEIGVDTLEEYRCNGYATAACAGLIRHCINEGKTPIWRCKAGDTISERLAQKLGFRYLGTEYYMNSLFADKDEMKTLLSGVE